ncbi:zinc dependent phospholipase C family protein [Exiguobacterium aestuarii]|uniref:Zinc dependent phospholipase C family protein n=1 Tax=Exiguobacterium aestuarii TaxID=273527 RepID=A0ABW2PKR3_9BACL|nr:MULTISPECIES: zinc dependent phospholipase C family protein [Exiguobacterium]MCT4785809.1 zinc dependent phospholipase C family protein [Exiguobacterium aestuarii]
MGSHLMHLVIANEMAEELPELDEVAFILGSLAPDATTEKGDSHYYAGRHDDLSRRLDLNQYWRDSEGEDISFRLGYYAHLVADEIWLQGFYKGWLKEVITQHPEKQAAYYADFDAYNARLSKRLGKFDFERLKRKPTFDELIEKVERDAAMTEEGTYTMFLPHQFDGYVDTCVRRCLEMVKRKRAMLV